jgi:glycosyltransferase involved in cell wall biosynthesis
VAAWLLDTLRSIGAYTVDIHDLARSSHDPGSRRLMVPNSWIRKSLRNPVAGHDDVVHWGANAVEIEAMRYRPRTELTQALQQYDLIQVVSGGPALAATVVNVGVPTVLQVATRIAWERAQPVLEVARPLGVWRRTMTAWTSHIESHAIRQVDFVLVENAAMLAYVQSLGQSHVSKAFPGVDIQRFSPRQEGWLRDGYILSVCRLNDPRKGIDRLINAYALMVRTDQHTPELVLAGRGRLTESANALIDSLRLSTKITVMPDIGEQQLPNLYRSASLYIQASYEEGLGISVVEAMASGLPVVTTKTAGTSETVVEGVTGYLISQDLAEAVPKLLATRAMEVLRGDGESLAAGSRERCVSLFASDIALRRFTDTYDGLLMRDPS